MEVVQALAELHCHKPNPIIHGDPRLPNLIIHDKSLSWIDLLMNFDDIHTPISAILFAGDMHILIESLFPQTKRHVDPRIDELVNVYSQNLDSDSIAKLVEYLTELNRRI
jgi:tRNA A-37 threonylcarbamoyl transferase component Bud32